jgi:hypothetical protein
VLVPGSKLGLSAVAMTSGYATCRFFFLFALRAAIMYVFIYIYMYMYVYKDIGKFLPLHPYVPVSLTRFGTMGTKPPGLREKEQPP